MEHPYRNPVTLARAYKKYGSAEKIAEAWGCSDRTIRTWLHEHDEIDVKGRGRPPSYDTDDPPNHVLEDDEGYELVESFVPDGEGGYTRKHVKIHVLVAIAEWGIDAVKDNDVHHRTGCKIDNRPDNLVPMDPKRHGGIDMDRRKRDAARSFR